MQGKSVSSYSGRIYFVIGSLLLINILSFSTVATAQTTPQTITIEQAIALEQQGHAWEAVEMLKSIIRREESPRAVETLITFAEKHDLWDELRFIPVRMFILDSSDGNFQADLAYSLALNNKTDDAEKIANQAVEAGANNGRANLALAIIYQRKEQHKEALVAIENALTQNNNLIYAHLARSMSLLALNRYAEAVKSLEAFIARAPDYEVRNNKSCIGSQAKNAVSQESGWCGQLAALRRLSEQSLNNSSSLIYRGTEVTQKARVLTKPEPCYTEAARHAGLEGTARIKVVLGEDGTVKDILATTWLAGGLTLTGINAARQLRFVPAQKDGRLVSQWIYIEYNFNLY